jgi:hypothetical protein
VPAREKTQERIKKLAFADKDEVFPNLLKNKSKPMEIPRRSSITLENDD